jgi:hypothetical protein
MKTADTQYFVRTDDVTEEEQHSWEFIEKACRAGQFTPETRIFFPDKNMWVRAGDTDLQLLFPAQPAAAKNQAPAAQEPDDAETSALEAEYNEALDRVAQQPSDVDARVEAGRLAAELDQRDAARKHFQNALNLSPFNTRVANEVMRRFSRSECRSFQYLRRDPPVADDPAELLTYPFAAGPLHVAIPAAALLVLSLVPNGQFAAIPLAYLWMVQVARRVAAGSRTPPTGKEALANPVREIILPLLAGAVVAAECALVVYGVGRASMAVGGGEGSAFQYVANSPVLSVTLAVAALAYLPAVMTKTIHSVGFLIPLLNPQSVVRSVVRMDQEYAVSALIVLFLAAVLGGMRLLLDGIPFVGKLVFVLAAAWAIPAAGLVLGRLAGRMRHVL